LFVTALSFTVKPLPPSSAAGKCPDRIRITRIHWDASYDGVRRVRGVCAPDNFVAARKATNLDVEVEKKRITRSNQKDQEFVVP
jgi:hypothetical protein